MDNNLRKDQIYFVEKDFTGESEVYSLLILMTTLEVILVITKDT